MKFEKYLPIGTVVMLREGKHRLMITGFCASEFEVQKKVYDYIGCFYPEGLITLDRCILFNHNDIDKIYYLGLSDNEEKQFKQKLVQFMKSSSGNN